MRKIFFGLAFLVIGFMAGSLLFGSTMPALAKASYQQGYKDGGENKKAPEPSPEEEVIDLIENIIDYISQMRA